MAENKEEITYFGETDFRGKKTPFGIKKNDRARHVYVIGKTGMGKSTTLENMAVQDIKNGNGVAFIDPHGGSAEKLLEYIPKERIKDVIYFAPHDIDNPISFNVMEGINKEQRHLVANGLMAAFKKIWPDVWSARMEYISNNILLALLEYPDSTLLGVNRMLSDKVFRKKVVENISDPSVKSFWVDEFAKYTEKLMTEAGASIQNKFGQFTANPLIRNLIGQTKATFDIRDVMDNKKILIINLSKGRMGEMNSNLIGGMLITKIYLSAMSRANASESELKKLPNFYLYVDEFQSFVNDSFADILSEARKYKLNLTIAHQYIEQMPETVRNAVFGNVGTTIAFRVGPFDAEVLEKVFAPKFTAEDIVNLGFAQIYLSLMIDGVGSAPFSATTLPPITKPEISYMKDVIENSRKTYARPKEEVESDIKKWYEAGLPAPASPPPARRAGVGGGQAGTEEGAAASAAPFRPVSQAPSPLPIKRSFPPAGPAFSSKPSFRSAIPPQRTSYQRPIRSSPAVQISGSSVIIPKRAEPFRRSEPVVNPVSPQKISLSSLAKKEPALKEEGKFTGKHIGDLKAALAEAVSSKPAVFSLKKDEDGKKGNFEPVKTVKDSARDIPKKEIKEVPEEVLRDILDTKKIEEKIKNESNGAKASGADVK